ncbi:MAG: DUF4242 domain-containing protein [Gemmatimonadetes bacterium]|nr:DUF4242 domain-containing protein [Gemmatimonadota bacterium]
MPLFMDVHRNLEGVTAEALRAAHLKDVDVQERFNVQYHKYFFNQATGTAFCLAEGPDAAACHAVHRESHGLIADDIIEVQPELVEAFFATTRYDDVGAAVTIDGRPDGALRVIMFTEIANYTEVARADEDEAVRLLQCHDRVVRAVLAERGGHEVRHTGEGIMACFSSVSAAVNAAAAIQQRCRSQGGASAGHHPVLRIGMSAGEPVEQHRDLFGAVVNTARRICEAAEPGQILVSAALRELGLGKATRFHRVGERLLKGIEEAQVLYDVEWRSEHAVREAGEPPLRRAADVVRGLWGELLRRRVVKVAVAYGIVLFAILQVAQLTLEPLGLPAWSYTLVLVLGLLGLPLALVLAWAFDVTPAGLERTATAAARDSGSG